MVAEDFPLKLSRLGVVVFSLVVFLPVATPASKIAANAGNTVPSKADQELQKEAAQRRAHAQNTVNACYRGVFREQQAAQLEESEHRRTLKTLESQTERLKQERFSMEHKKDCELNELRKGLFCTGCGKTRSQILATGSQFPHPGQRIRKATPEEIDAKRTEWDAKIGEVSARILTLVKQLDSLRQYYGNLERDHSLQVQKSERTCRDVKRSLEDDLKRSYEAALAAQHSEDGAEEAPEGGGADRSTEGDGDDPSSAPDSSTPDATDRAPELTELLYAPSPESGDEVGNSNQTGAEGHAAENSTEAILEEGTHPSTGTSFRCSRGIAVIDYAAKRKCDSNGNEIPWESGGIKEIFYNTNHEPELADESTSAPSSSSTYSEQSANFPDSNSSPQEANSVQGFVYVPPAPAAHFSQTEQASGTGEEATQITSDYSETTFTQENLRAFLDQGKPLLVPARETGQLIAGELWNQVSENRNLNIRRATRSAVGTRLDSLPGDLPGISVEVVDRYVQDTYIERLSEPQRSSFRIYYSVFISPETNVLPWNAIKNFRNFFESMVGRELRRFFGELSEPDDSP